MDSDIFRARTLFLDTFQYHVSCTDGRISDRINLSFYLFFTVVPSNSCAFLFCRHFVVNMTFSTGLVGVKKFRINDERPTGKKHTTVGWDDSGKIGKIINSFRPALPNARTTSGSDNDQCR